MPIFHWPSRAGQAPKREILKADDLGLTTAVNEAVEQAHRHGVLNTTSLMVTAPASAEAVRRAQANPKLNVGLYLVLADGRPALPPAAIPDLLDQDGRFGAVMGREGARYFHPATRCAAEIDANQRGYQNAREREALLSPRVAAALIDQRNTRIGFRDLG